MPPDKPLKLLPESVRTFLEIGLKYVINKQGSTKNKKRKKSSMFKFVRMLCVSNFYLNCSRRANLDIYRLNLSFNQYSDKLSISFTSKRYDSLNKVSLSYDYARKLINLFFSPYTGVYFDYGIKTHLIEQQFELLKLVKGKIRFDLRMCFDKKFAQNLLKLFADRTYELHCRTKFFMFDKCLQFPILDYLFVDSLESFDQLSYILQHNIKELEVDQIYRNFAIEDGNRADSRNKTVKKLKLPCVQVDYDKFEELIEYLRKSCLNLKYLDLKARFVHLFPRNEVSDQVVTYVRRMNDLKTRFGNRLISMFIKFEVQILANDEHDSSWIEKVCKNSEFNGWNVKSSKETFYGTTFEIVFDNAGCKLEMSFSSVNF